MLGTARLRFPALLSGSQGWQGKGKPTQPADLENSHQRRAVSRAG
jgi:hypothetical protein